MKTKKKSKKRQTIKKYFKIGGKKIKLKKLNCSPKPKSEINSFSCYSNQSLFKLRDLWNARHPDITITTNLPKDIHYQLSE
jgi:hypothetical protein